MAYLAIAFGALLLGAIFRDALIRACQFLLLMLGAMACARTALNIAPQLDTPNVLWGFALGGLAGFIVVGLILTDRIRHALIYFYLRRSIQRDKDAAKAGRLW